MRILLTGITGQVGSALQSTLPPLGEIILADRARLDLARPDSIREVVRTTKPHVIVNAAAYTAVDRAESEQSLARSINADGPALLGEEAVRLGALLVHFSTDYVFDGEKPTPYTEADVTAPVNVYGLTKLAGERAIADCGCRYLILRTSWVYAASGRNFMLTMLKLARQGTPLRIVNDQFGAPTSNMMIADALPVALHRVAADASLEGLYHMTASGQTTWHGFANAIFTVTGDRPEVVGIPASEYKTPARRPRNSVLDNGKLSARLGIRLPSWEDGLRQVLQSRR